MKKNWKWNFLNFKVEITVFKCRSGNCRGKIIKCSSKYYYQIKDKQNDIAVYSTNDKGQYYNTYQECFSEFKKCWKESFSNYPFD
jgi:hypothetical protein